MNKEIVLPNVADAMYKGNSALDVLGILRKGIHKLPGDFLYRTPIDLKLEELENCIKYIDSEQPFIFKMKNEWASQIRLLLIKSQIKFDLDIRRKSVFSTLLKMNRIMAEQKAIDSIHDLVGFTVIINTQGPKDTVKSIHDCYVAMNTIIKYFMNASKHKEGRFLLCESSGVKGAVPNFDANGKKLSANDKRNLIKIKNDNLFIPESSELLPELQNFCKDYNHQPKQDSFYTGLQCSICFIDEQGKRFYFEVQVKSQNQSDYLKQKVLEDGTPNPAYHDNFREIQTEINKTILENTKSMIPQFDLNFESEKCYHIYGFREDPEKDHSGILAPKTWSICNATHN